MMDSELSVRIAWYCEYVVYADLDIDKQEEKYLVIKAAEEFETFDNLPKDIQLRVLEAERNYTKEEFPYLRAPRD